jgi:hypothetical protein
MMFNEPEDIIMKCCHCSCNAFREIDGVALCLNCHTDFQNVANNQINSAFQLHRGSAVADSMLKAKASLLHNQNIERQIKNERNTEVNNYNTHNNNIVYGNNSGTLQTGKTQIQNNDIGVANLSKSNNGNVGWLAKIIAKGLQIAKYCLQLIGFFR